MTKRGLPAVAKMAMAAVALAGCGGRPATWSEEVSHPSSAYGLRDAVALVDGPADRVVLLEPGAKQDLTIDPVAVGTTILNVVPSPRGNKLFVVSAGHRAALGDDRPTEAPSLTVIQPSSSPRAERYVLDFLTDPLSGLAIDPIEERWAVMYAGSGPSQALVHNPNELVFIDLAQPPETATPVKYTLHSFGGRPVRLTFTPPLMLPGRAMPDRLLIVESDQDLSILRLGDPTTSEVTVPLTSGVDNRRLAPAGITVDDGDPSRDDDARIGVRLLNDPSVIIFQLAPEAGGGVGFRPTPNLTDVGGIPSDIKFVRTDGGLRLAALVPSKKKATLVDPVSTLSTEVALPAGYQNLSLITEVAGGGAASNVDVALLWNGSTPQDGVAFWELGQTAGEPYRSIETVGVITAIAEVLDVPNSKTLKVLKSTSANAFYVLDLGSRTAAPLVTSTSAIALSMSPLGDQVWTFVPGGTEVAATDLTSEHPRSLLIERPVQQVFEVARPDGTPAVIVVHASGGMGATVYDVNQLDDQTRRLYSGLLIGGPY